MPVTTLKNWNSHAYTEQYSTVHKIRGSPYDTILMMSVEVGEVPC